MTLATFSKGVVTSLAAADILAQRGIDCEVINLRSLRPLDREAIINSVMKTHHLVTVENGWPQYGVGAEIIASVMESECAKRKRHFSENKIIKIIVFQAFINFVLT